MVLDGIEQYRIRAMAYDDLDAIVQIDAKVLGRGRPGRRGQTPVSPSCLSARRSRSSGPRRANWPGGRPSGCRPRRGRHGRSFGPMSPAAVGRHPSERGPDGESAATSTEHPYDWAAQNPLPDRSRFTPQVTVVPGDQDRINSLFDGYPHHSMDRSRQDS